MKKLILLAVAVLMIASLIGCAQKQVAAPPEQPTAKPSEETKKPESVTEKQPTVKPEEVTGAQKELGISVNDIHFAFDKYDLDDNAKVILKDLSGVLSSNPKAKVVIEGNCDERGTKEYNIALGEKRASAAKQYLISLGIPSARIDTVSYGKEKPICTDSTEDCWSKNRRDHFVLVEAGK